MGVLPGQSKGELYGAEWTFRRTWVPEEMRCVSDLLSDEQFSDMWDRAKSLQERPRHFNPEPNAIRQALLEIFAWGCDEE